VVGENQEMAMRQGIKVFSATKHVERNNLGEAVTAWINEGAEKTIKDIRTIQSSDSEFHCLSIVVIYTMGEPH
jgi:predicted amino acid racemase